MEGTASGKARGVIVDGARSVAIAIVAIVVAFGVINVILTTALGQNIVDRLRPHGQGRYQFVYGAAARVLLPLGLLILVVTYRRLAHGRRSGRAKTGTKLLAVGLALAASTWGFWLYDRRQAQADDDREYATVLDLVNRQKGEAQALFVAYDKQLAAVKLDGLLDPENLGSKAAIVDARQRLDALGRAVTALEDGFASSQARLRNEVEALAMPESRKRETLAGFDEHMPERESLVRAFAGAERDIVTAAEQIVGYAGTRSGKPGGDTREYDRLRGRLRAAVEREERIAGQLQGGGPAPATSNR
jgi:hypothetical protein